MIFITVFDAHSAYTEYASSEDMLHPNVSYCKFEEEVHYDPLFANKLVVTYCQSSDPSPKKLSDSGIKLYTYAPEAGIMGSTMFNKVVINGVEANIGELDANSGKTDAPSDGSCLTVEYFLKDPTFLGVEGTEQITRLGASFSKCPNITSVQIPNSVTAIGENFINGYSNTIEIETLEIPNSVRSIAEGAFAIAAFGALTIGSGVTSIGNNPNVNALNLTIYATTPPSEYLFIDAVNIYVPESAVNTYKTTWSSVADRIYPIGSESGIDPSDQK